MSRRLLPEFSAIVLTRPAKPIAWSPCAWLTNIALIFRVHAVLYHLHLRPLAAVESGCRSIVCQRDSGQRPALGGRRSRRPKQSHLYIMQSNLYLHGPVLLASSSRFSSGTSFPTPREWVLLLRYPHYQRVYLPHPLEYLLPHCSYSTAFSLKRSICAFCRAITASTLARVDSNVISVSSSAECSVHVRSVEHLASCCRDPPSLSRRIA